METGDTFTFDLTNDLIIVTLLGRPSYIVPDGHVSVASTPVSVASAPVSVASARE